MSTFYELKPIKKYNKDDMVYKGVKLQNGTVSKKYFFNFESFSYEQGFLFQSQELDDLYLTLVKNVEEQETENPLSAGRFRSALIIRMLNPSSVIKKELVNKQIEEQIEDINMAVGTYNSSGKNDFTEHYQKQMKQLGPFVPGSEFDNKISKLIANKFPKGLADIILDFNLSLTNVKVDRSTYSRNGTNYSSCWSSELKSKGHWSLSNMTTKHGFKK